MEISISVAVISVLAGLVSRFAGVERPRGTEFLGVCQGFANRFSFIKATDLRVLLILVVAFVGWKVLVGYFIIAMMMRSEPRVVRNHDFVVSTEGEGETAA